MKIEASGSIRYPDATVACGPVQPLEKLLADPVIVFEVESDSTALVDQTVKNPEYEATPSIMRYVMLSAGEGRRHGVRAGGRCLGPGRWRRDPGKVLAMPEIGVEVPLGEFYEGVTLPAADTARRSRYRRR